MTFAPPSAPDQQSAPTPPSTTAPGWYQPSPLPSAKPKMVDHGRPNWFRAAIVAVPLIGIGVSSFMFLSARNDANEISDRALDVVESAVADISVPEVSDAPDVAEPVVTVAVPVAESTSATAAAPIAPATESVVAVTLPASGSMAGGSIAVVPVTDLWSAEGSAEVTATYEATLSGEPTRFLDLLIYDTYAFATAQDATIPSHVDEYPFRNGTIGESRPVELLGDGDLESSLWSLADVDITQIPRMVGEAPGLTGLEEPEVVYVRIERSVFHDGFPVTMKVYIDGPRGSGYVEYDAAGNLIQVMV